MRKSFLAAVMVVLCGLTLVVCWRSRDRRTPVENSVAETTQQTPTSVLTNHNAKARLEELKRNISESERERDPEFLTANGKLAFQKFEEFARVVNLYNFDPTFVGCREKNNGRYVLGQTKTHVYNYENGRISFAASSLDGMNPHRDREGRGRATWYQCTGKMTEKEAVDTTLSLLQALNETKVLEAVKNGKHNVTATSINVQDPNGITVQVAPFVVVDLYDEVQTWNRRVSVEFRMGQSGMAGVTRWNCR